MLRSRIMRVAGVTAIVAGSGLTPVSPASAAPVPDAASLRAAISGLNGTGPAAEIELVPGVTYSLPGTDSCQDEDDNLSGDLDVRRTEPLKIFTRDNAPPAILRNDCDASTPQRIIDVKAPAGLYGAGRLTLRNIIFRDGHAPTGTPNGDGGAVRSVADLVIENSRFENNTAGNGNAGKAVAAAGERGGSGGAVATFGSVTIDRSVFIRNAAGPGAAGWSTSGVCTDPAAGNGGPAGAGGAVFAAGGGTITNSAFFNNRAGAGGDGGSDSCVRTGEAVVAGAGGPGGGGGALACGTVVVDKTYVCRGDLTVRASTFSGNSTGAGGAGGAGGPASGVSSLAAGSAATGGVGGIGGNGGNGGAVQFIGQTGETPTRLAFENSTFDANSTGAGGRGGGNGGRGTAAHVTFDGTSTTPLAFLTHVTMVGGGAGAAGEPGAMGESGRVGGGTLVVESSPWVGRASVIGGGDGPSCSSASETPVSSMSTDDSCGFGAANVHPFSAFALAPLASNGGPTATRLPGAGSVLFDSAGSWILATDQRGMNRPHGAGFYIGAVEVSRTETAENPSGPVCPSTGPGGGSYDNCSGGGAWVGGSKDKDNNNNKDNNNKDKDKDKDKDSKDKDNENKDSKDKGKDTGEDVSPTLSPGKEVSGEPKENAGPGPSPAAAAAATDGGAETLSQTGFWAGPVTALGILLIIAGATMVVISYRRPGRHRLESRQARLS